MVMNPDMAVDLCENQSTQGITTMKQVQIEYKAYYTTSEVANITGVKPSAIREAKRKKLITPSQDFDIAALIFDANEVVRYAATRDIEIVFSNKE
jgi:hypothetical protein